MEDIIVVYKEKNVGSKNNKGFVLSSKTRKYNFGASFFFRLLTYLDKSLSCIMWRQPVNGSFQYVHKLSYSLQIETTPTL